MLIRILIILLSFCFPFAAVAAPTITNVLINTGYAATNSRDVTVDVSYTGTPTSYIASENSNFSGASWKTFSSRFSFNLSSGYGKKKVYVAIKDSKGTSSTYSRSITYVSSTTPWALKLNLNNGNTVSTTRRIKVTWRALGSPTYFQASESKYFTGLSWKKITPTTPSIKLSPFSGTKTVYFRVKNSYGISPVIQASVKLVEPENLLLSKTIKPSVKAQRVNIDASTALVIPSGTLTKPTLLTVKSNPLPADYIVPGMQALGTFDISLGDLHDFSQKPLRLEYKYSPTVLRTDVAPELQFYSSYWDNDTKQWVYEPVLVYRDQNKIVVQVKHLSTRTVSQMKSTGSGFVSNWYSRTVYEKKLDAPFGGINSYQAKVSAYVEEAIRGYRDAGFKIPSSQILIAILKFDVEKTAEYGSGMIDVPVTYYDDEELKFALYHEVFHAIQNEYMSSLSMYRNRWFIEATADYAAASFSGLTHLMGKGLKHRFLEKSITYDPDVNDQHKYQVAHFLKYAFGTSFKEMFEYVANDSWYETCVTSLDSFVKSKGGGSFAQKYQEFARHYVFESNSPGPEIEDTLRTEVGVDPQTLRYGEEAVEGSFDLEADYSAKVWSVWIDSDDDGYKYLKAEVPGGIPDRVEIDVFRVADDSVRTGGKVGTLTKNSNSLTFRTFPGDSVYMLAVNVNFQTASLRLKLSDIAPKIETIVPEESYWGQEIVINGKNFGATKGASLIKGLNEYSAISVNSWSNTQIKFGLPITMPDTYDLYIQKEGEEFANNISGDAKQVIVNIAPLVTAKSIYGFGFVGNHSYSGNCPDEYLCPSGSSSIDSSYGVNHTSALPAVLNWTGRNFSAQLNTVTSTGFTYSFSLSGEIDESGKTLTEINFSQTWIKNSKVGYKTYLHTGDISWRATNVPLYLHPGISASPIIFSALQSSGISLSSYISQVRDNVVEREEICDNPPVNTINCRYIRNFSKTYSSTNNANYWQIALSLE